MADLNENKPGYKKTKVGWIPEEWEILKLENISAVSGGYAFKSQKMQSHGEYQIVKMSNVYNGTLDLTRNPSFISFLTERETVAKLFEGDIIISLTGTIGKRDYGYTVLIDDTKNLLLNQRLAKIVANKKSDQVYLYYTTKSSSFLNQFFLEGLGGTGNQANVGISDLKRVKLPLPPLPEQRQIATLLSTWDTAIDKLGQLIAKKQALKKGLMQQLLSGRVRFPEFVPPGGTKYKETKVGRVPEDWEVVKAGKIFERVSKKGQSGELLAVTQEEGVIPRSHLERRVVMPSGSTDGYKLVEPGNFIITLRSFQGGLEYSEYRGLVSPAYNIITYNSKSVNSSFFRHYFKSYRFIERLSSAVIGIRDGKQISYPDFKRQLIPLPSYEEQEAIGAFLEKVDKEINNLENQRINFQTQKKGLMQQLLTGAVRITEQMTPQK